MRLPLPSLEAILLSLALATLAALGARFSLPIALNNVFYDTFQRGALSGAPDDIIIVGVDEASLQGIGKWPWRRDLHAQLIDRLSEAGVKAIAYDIVFSERDTPQPQYDAQLVDAVARNGKVVLPVFVGLNKQGGQLIEILPFDELADAAHLAHAHIEIDKDGVLRSTHLLEGLGTAYWKHMTLVLHELAYGPYTQALPGLRANIQESEFNQRLIVRDYRNRIRFFAQPGGFKTISFIDVLDGRYPPDSLRDKIIFVGTTAAGLTDTLATPVSNENQHMQGVELNANIFEALRTNTLIYPLTELEAMLISFTLCFLFALVITSTAPSVSLASGVILSASTTVASFIVLAQYQIWWPPGATFIAVALSYPLWTWSQLNRSMQYLREELHSLDQEVSLLEEQPPLSQLKAGLSQIVRWFPARSWQVETETNTGKVAARPFWSHKHAQSTAVVVSNESAASLEVDWRPSDSASKLRGVMLDDLLKPWQTIEKPTSRSGNDVVAFHIDQLRKSHANRRQLRHFIFSCLANLSDGVVATSLSGRIILLNDEARRLLNIDQDTVLDQTFIDLLELGLEKRSAALQQAIDDVYLRSKPTEIEFRAANGVELWLQANEFELEDADNKVIVFTLTDITQMREMERTRAETLNFVSHDLRSPLVSILALTENASTQSEEFASVRRYAQRALSYTESFLQLARAETDNISFYECDLHSIADNAAEYVYALASNRKIRISAEHCDEDLWIWGNGDLLERMLINLLDNAIKYSRFDSSIRLSLRSSDFGGKRLATISVKDEGIGIPEEDLPRLFDPFQRGTSEESRTRRGAGLGLRFIHVTAQRHKGQVEVKSKHGQGSEFSVHLPLLDLSDQDLDG